MRTRSPQKTRELIRVLVHGDVDFIIVGGVAATLHGSTLNTIDLDVIAPFSEENLRKLFDALSPYAPHHASRLDLDGIAEDAKVLMKWRLLLIETDLGRLDVLHRMDPVGAFRDCEAVSYTIEENEVRVLSREQLIRVKRHVARPKDLLVAEELAALADRS